MKAKIDFFFLTSPIFNFCQHSEAGMEGVTLPKNGRSEAKKSYASLSLAHIYEWKKSWKL